jgi:hypothetical protein
VRHLAFRKMAAATPACLPALESGIAKEKPARDANQTRLDFDRDIFDCDSVVRD